MGKFMKNRVRILLFSLFLFTSSALPAQDNDTLIDNGDELILPSFDSSTTTLEKWKASGDFNYMTYLDSMLREANLKVDTVRVNKQRDKQPKPAEKETSSWMAQIFNFNGANSFFWVLAILFIGFIIYKVFIQSGFFSLLKKNKHVSSDPEPEEELKETHTYDRFISTAEGEGKFNQATRYWYLKTLKNLKDKELIQYSPDKTNQEYVFELSNSPLQKRFRELTRNYEYVWYGEFFLQEERYQNMRTSFEAFNQEVINKD